MPLWRVYYQYTRTCKSKVIHSEFWAQNKCKSGNEWASSTPKILCKMWEWRWERELFHSHIVSHFGGRWHHRTQRKKNNEGQWLSLHTLDLHDGLMNAKKWEWEKISVCSFSTCQRRPVLSCWYLIDSLCGFLSRNLVMRGELVAEFWLLKRSFCWF